MISRRDRVRPLPGSVAVNFVVPLGAGSGFEGFVSWLVTWLIRKRRPFRGFSIAAYVIGDGHPLLDSSNSEPVWGSAISTSASL